MDAGGFFVGGGECGKDGLEVRGGGDVEFGRRGWGLRARGAVGDQKERKKAKKWHQREHVAAAE